ncbi:hypothetical protein [uncultured Paraglaciecola sp.]|uniref:hypothetical protein n=1 Tax=uncultured Paraglaciecola sp. TaxID=1765024 RepID=UPI0030D7D5C1|tara:strand:+ start:67489 stop:68286 length:798 start_codon:yes stop_codon:yes gene_type:complete
MFDGRISKYLEKIEHGKAFNFSAFLSLLPESLKEDVERNASVNFLRKNSVIVTISCEKLLKRLYELTIEPESRVSATLLGNSHKVKTSTSYLFVYHQQCDDIHPDTVVCNKENASFKFQPKKQVLIIENSELFFSRDALLSQMNKVFSLSLSFENTDLVFGSGNQVTNIYNQEFLNQYESVLCFFDYDFGGLKIFKAMKNIVGGKAQFLEPNSDDLDIYFVKKPKNKDQYLKAVKAAEDLGLKRLNRLFLTTKLFMEQEAILAFE